MNKGYITVEACLVVPLFLFFWLAMANIYMVLFAEAHIHQALAEAANDTAGQCYLEKKLLSDKNTSIEKLVNQVYTAAQFRTYLGDDFFVEQCVSGGKQGVLITVKKDSKNAKVFLVKATFMVKLQIPVLGDFHIALTDTIKQKAFVGYSPEETSDRYVYITPNQAVYHTRRSCTHLALEVDEKMISGSSGYVPCGFCAKNGRNAGKIYVARTSNVYHYSKSCSGLKRTVSRVKLSELSGMGACLRCGD